MAQRKNVPKKHSITKQNNEMPPPPKKTKTKKQININNTTIIDQNKDIKSTTCKCVVWFTASSWLLVCM